MAIRAAFRISLAVFLRTPSPTSLSPEYFGKAINLGAESSDRHQARPSLDAGGSLLLTVFVQREAGGQVVCVSLEPDTKVIIIREELARARREKLQHTVAARIEQQADVTRDRWGGRPPENSQAQRRRFGSAD